MWWNEMSKYHSSSWKPISWTKTWTLWEVFWPDWNLNLYNLLRPKHDPNCRSLFFLAKWQNSSKNVPHNQFKPSLQGKLADFRDLLALISSPFFSLVTMWRVLRFWCLMGIMALVHSSAVGHHLTLPDALYHARIDPKILRCTLQSTPPLIKP